jgi:hypothetical protein
MSQGTLQDPRALDLARELPTTLGRLAAAGLGGCDEEVGLTAVRHAVAVPETLTGRVGMCVLLSSRPPMQSPMSDRPSLAESLTGGVGSVGVATIRCVSECVALPCRSKRQERASRYSTRGEEVSK